jgi:hypothetical protein
MARSSSRRSAAAMEKAKLVGPFELLQWVEIGRSLLKGR